MELPKAIARLIDEHREVERQLDVLVASGALMQDGRLDAEAENALRNALIFFEVTVVRHVADEEQSILPVLRKRLKDKESHFAHLLDHIVTDHVDFAEMERELGRLAQRLIGFIRDKGSASELEMTRDLELFVAVAAQLKEFYASHILVEERDVFPALAVALSEDELHQIVAEIEARRGA